MNPQYKNPSSEDWMNEAFSLASQAAKEDEVPVGAIVVFQGQIVGRGYNRREQDQSPIAHAEILAIQEAAASLKSWRLNECVLFVTLEPCPMCLAAVQQARIQEVYYGATDSKGGALSLGYRLHENPKTNHRFKVTHQESSQCSQILKDFFAKKRKKK
jgi:tRNA(adenine34) deaminase